MHTENEADRQRQGRRERTPSPLRPLIQCRPVADVSLSACPTRHIRHITGIWTNIRQIRSARCNRADCSEKLVMPGEVAGEWDKGGHLFVIIALRFGDRIRLMTSSNSGEAKNQTERAEREM